MTQKTVNNIGMLVRCYEGLRNVRALLLLSGGAVGGLLLMAAAAVAAQRLGFIASLVVAVLALLVYLAGVNGAGLLLVDQADDRTARSVGAAFFGGLHATLTALLSLLLLGVGLLLVFLLLLLLSYLGRIPGIGPLFAFLFAGPGAVALAFCYGLLAIGVPLLLVAIWRGHGVLGSIGRAIDIVLKRPLDALLHFVLLGLIVGPVALFVIGLVTVTSGASVSMFATSSFLGSTSHWGGGYNPYGDALMSSPLDGFLSSLQQAGAASASVGVVMAVLIAMFTLVAMFGYILVHDSLGAGMDATAESQLRGGFSQLKQKMEQHRPAPIAPAATAAACQGCGARLTAGDRFCGECGQPA
jgi:hypothetical protein